MPILRHPIDVPRAGQMLGVSTARVRQLIAGRHLPAFKVGGVWALPRECVEARAELRFPPARPLNLLKAWQTINAAEIDLLDGSRYQRRGLTTRWNRALAPPIEAARELGGMLSGTGAAAELLEPVINEGVGIPQPDLESDLYLPSSLQAQTVIWPGWEPASDGYTVVRFVDDDVWDIACSAAVPSALYPGVKLAPLTAIALDLMLHASPRSHDAAFSLIHYKERLLA